MLAPSGTINVLLVRRGVVGGKVTGGGCAGNLLVDEVYCVRVADFGLARVMHDLHTLTGGLGTFQWMAPEVLAHQRYSKKADVYSFAIVLWECTARQVSHRPELMSSLHVPCYLQQS